MKEFMRKSDGWSRLLCAGVCEFSDLSSEDDIL